jgi:GH35 family endo-1,4-beta-xylanase
MILLVNDYGIESINQKSTGLLAIAKDLHDKKLVDAVGFQTHLVAGQFPDSKCIINLSKPTISCSLCKKEV